MQIERVVKKATPEEQERETREYWQSRPPNEHMEETCELSELLWSIRLHGKDESHDESASPRSVGGIQRGVR